MTDHLPECPCAPYPIGDQVCICPELRACEQRVREDASQRLAEWAAYTFPLWTPKWVGRLRNIVAGLPDIPEPGPVSYADPRIASNLPKGSI